MKDELGGEIMEEFVTLRCILIELPTKNLKSVRELRNASLEKR